MPTWSIFKRKSISSDDFSKILNEVYENCMEINRDRPDLIKKHRIKALRSLQKLVEAIDPSEVDMKCVKTFVWCSISLIEYFHCNITAKESATQIPVKKQGLLNEALYLLTTIVDVLLEHSHTVYGTILTFLTDANLWGTECLCADIIKRYCHFYRLGHLRFQNSSLGFPFLLKHITHPGYLLDTMINPRP